MSSVFAFMRATIIALVAFLPVGACTSTSPGPYEPATAGNITPWLSDTKARAYVERVFKRERYATRIECRENAAGTIEVRFHTAEVLDGGKPFHKWQFVIAEPGGVEAAVSEIPLLDRPDLQYRIISRDRAGNRGECAVAYR